MIKQTVMMIAGILLTSSAFGAASSGCSCPSSVTPEQLKEMSENKKVKIGNCEFEAESVSDLQKALGVMENGIKRGEFENRVNFFDTTAKTNGAKCRYTYKKRYGSVFGTTPFTIMYTTPGVAHRPSSAEIERSERTRVGARHAQSAPAALAPHGAPPPLAPRHRPSAAAPADPHRAPPPVPARF